MAAFPSLDNNPLVGDWSRLPFKFPPFEEIETKHFRPAIEHTQTLKLNELKQIADNPEDPTFENTIAAIDRAGKLYSQVMSVYYNLTQSNSPSELQAVQMELAGPLAEYNAKVMTLPGMFERIKHVHDKRESLGLNVEQRRLVERYYLDYVRAGALFDKETQTKYNAIMKELAELTTKFAQNVMADESEITVLLTKDEIEGCPEDVVAAARQTAQDRKLGDDRYAITLGRSMVEPFLTTCPKREIRERVWRKWTSRGEISPERDNNTLVVRILQLRSQQAKYHGFKTFAEYQTSDTMAKTPHAVMDLLNRVWAPAKVAANHERAALEDFAKSKGDDAKIEPWDWRFYSEQLRCAKYDVDQNLIKPYLSLDRMTEALFDVAYKLYGLKFVLRPDLKPYHPDVLVYEVKEEIDGEDTTIAIFLHDNFARQNKSGGAWMSEFRSQNRNSDALGTNIIPIVINNNNFTKAPGNQPTLLSFDDCVTLFHEFGHGCHGMLSSCTYNRLSSTSVLRDYVELPSQLMEHWVRQPSVLQKHARHYETNEPIREELLNKFMAAMKFQQGFGTIEYTACALVDQALHELENVDNLDVLQFEHEQLKKLEMPEGIVMRHRIPHFAHLFATSSYAAAYYVYLWAEVLDADAFDAFLESGNLFDKETALRARKFIYSAGNSIDHMEGYRAFRGREPSIDPMLKKKGLI